MKKEKLPRIIYSIQFVVLMTYSALAVLTLLPLYFKKLGGSPSQIGILIGLFSLASFLSRPLGGWVLGRFSPRSVLKLGLFFFLISTILYLPADDLGPFMILVRIIHGVTFSLVILAAIFVAILATTEKDRAYALGVVSSGFMLPLLVMPSIGEIIIERLGYPEFFMTASLLVLIPFLYVLRSGTAFPAVTIDPKAADTGYFHLFRQKRIFLISVLTLVFEIGLSAALAFVPLLANETPDLRAGLFFTCLGATAVGLRLIGGRYLRSWGHPGWILPAFIFLSGGAVLTSWARSGPALILCGIVWGIGTGLLYPHLSARMVHGLSSRDQGKALSLFAGAVDLGFALGPVMFGGAAQIYGLRPSFRYLCLMILVSSLGLIFLGGRIFFRDDPTGETP